MLIQSHSLVGYLFRRFKVTGASSWHLYCRGWQYSQVYFHYSCVTSYHGVVAHVRLYFIFVSIVWNVRLYTARRCDVLLLIDYISLFLTRQVDASCNTSELCLGDAHGRHRTPNAKYYYCFFALFPSVPPDKYRVVPQKRQQPLPSTCHPVL